MDVLGKIPGRAVRFSDASNSPRPDFQDSPGKQGSFSKKQSNRSSAPESPSLLKAMDRKFESLDYFQLASDLRAQIPTKRNYFRFKPYPDTLGGAEIIEWFIALFHAVNITEANYLGTQLVVHGHLYNAISEDDDVFQSSNLYKFSAADRREFNIEQVDLAQVEKLLASSLRKRDLDTAYFTYYNVFSGSDAINLIVQKGLVTKRRDAVLICDKLFRSGQITVVQSRSRKHEFLDEPNSFYDLKAQKKAVQKAKTGSQELIHLGQFSRDQNIPVQTTKTEFGPIPIPPPVPERKDSSVNIERSSLRSVLERSNRADDESHKTASPSRKMISLNAIVSPSGIPSITINDLQSKEAELDSAPIPDKPVVKKHKSSGDPVIERGKSQKTAVRVKMRSKSVAPLSESRNDSDTSLREFIHLNISRDSGLFSSSTSLHDVTPSCSVNPSVDP